MIIHKYYFTTQLAPMHLEANELGSGGGESWKSTPTLSTLVYKRREAGRVWLRLPAF